MKKNTGNHTGKRLRLHDNMLGKLWYVWRVYEESGDEVAVNQDHQYAVGHSKLFGVFRRKSDADGLAERMPLKEKP